MDAGFLLLPAMRLSKNKREVTNVLSKQTCQVEAGA